MLRVLLQSATDGLFFFALRMLNYGDDAGGDELVMVTIYLIDDDDDCICMITNLNSPSVFRM